MSKIIYLTEQDLRDIIADYEKKYPQFTTEYIVKNFKNNIMVLDDDIMFDWAISHIMLEKKTNSSEQG